MFKKALSLLLSMMLVVTSLVATVVSVSAAGVSYPVVKNSQVTSGLRLKQLAEIM